MRNGRHVVAAALSSVRCEAVPRAQWRKEGGEAGVEVRLGNVTLPGGKQARGVVRGYRMSSTDDTLRASEQRAQEVRWACPHGVSWRA